LTIFFVDLVDSTVLATRVEPESYRLLVGRYREQVARAVNRYEGHIGSTKGDGLLAVFGHPIAHVSLGLSSSLINWCGLVASVVSPFARGQCQLTRMSRQAA
jgi:class 3 adenylate cyclase